MSPAVVASAVCPRPSRLRMGSAENIFASDNKGAILRSEKRLETPNYMPLF